MEANNHNNDTKLDIKNNMEQYRIKNEIENEIESCCGSRCDKRVLAYMNKTAIIFIVLIFSIFQLLFFVEDTSEKGIYINICMVILGTAINKDKNREQKR